MMIQQIRNRTPSALLALAVLACLSLSPAQAATAPPIDGDLSTKTASAPAAAPAATPTVSAQGAAPATSVAAGAPERLPYNLDVSGVATPGTAPAGAAPVAANGSTTYHKDDLIGAAESVFGKGAKGVADVIQDILKKQGEPNAYIVGREGGGALVVGLRYGSGTLFHKVEGQRPVYWTGPSVGFDAGASAGSTFVLVYNLYNTDDLYHRFPAGEGQAYLIGGFHVSYLRRGNVVLIPVRVGVGLRLGVNAGYMKITKKSRIFPF